MKLLEQYYEVLNTENKLEIDRYYYVDNGLNNCINQIFSIAFQKEIKMMENVHYLPMGKEKKIQLQDIVTLISNVYKDNHNINDVKYGIEKAYKYYVTKEETDYDFNLDKLHQINNPRRLAYDIALEKKKLERKNKNLKKIKTSSVREVTHIKGQRMITSYIGVVKKTIVN
jgi:tRNA U34 5-carboxymethylaminomethyl modifying enzyme MnmG/GidA